MRLMVIFDDPHCGAFNMAADCFLLSRCSGNEVWLRFYTWEPPCVSLGYMQDAEATLDAEALRRDGLEWVRRPTGGRAILHWDDLTYSCVFSRDNAVFGRSIAESYGVVARCLIAGLVRMGVCALSAQSRLDARQERCRVKLPCFLSPNRDEIMVNGRKLVGSAQKRTERTVLQHGSIPIGAYFRRLPEFLSVDEQQRAVWRKLLYEKAICLDECGRSHSAGDTARFLADGFAHVLRTPPTLYRWSCDELSLIESHALGSIFTAAPSQREWGTDCPLFQRPASRRSVA